LNNADTLSVTFKDIKGFKTHAGDRLVFLYNRNQFGRNSASDNGDIADIVLSKSGTFTGRTRVAKTISVTAGGGVINITAGGAQLDRTGDPRLGRCELLGIFKHQRIALSIAPADGSTPRVLLYTGNIQGRVKGGQNSSLAYIPEESITGMATTKEPNPKKQEP
jgi:hypothetical protein